MDCSSVCDVRVTAGGGQVAAHAGLSVLGRLADGLGLGEALSAVVPHAGGRAPVHGRGRVLVHAVLMLAGGEEACADIEHLRAQPVLFGPVASDSTLYRVVHALAPLRRRCCVRRQPVCAPGCGSASATCQTRWCSTSIRRWWRCILGTSRARRRTSRAGSGSTRCCEPPTAAR